MTMTLDVEDITADRALLAEHEAALQKIDDAVTRASTLARDALSCRQGCSACCVEGLSVLPVEAALILSAGLAPPARPQPGRCVFLDEDGACTVYPVRPVVCRTHGLALRGAEQSTAPSKPRAHLSVLGDDVSACALNYTERAPTTAEVLDAGRVMMLLVTVDRRYRARVGLEDDLSRVALDDVAARLRAEAGWFPGAPPG